MNKVLTTMSRTWPSSKSLPATAPEQFVIQIFTEDEPSNDSNDWADCGVPGHRYKKINWLQAGLRTADKLLTVSPNYAAEIASGPGKGVEMDSIIA